jgi:nicotinate-nucleotide adenylyltransferase
MRIGYFGGSFDPPHLGHLAVARAAAEAFHLEQVLFVPTGRQPLKPEGALAPYADRLAMTALLCEGERGFATSDLEAPTADDAPSYTVDTLCRLQHLHPGAQLFVLAGADAFLTLRQWRSPEELLQLAEWIVVSRPGAGLRERLPGLGLTAEQLSRVHCLDGIAETASATEVRRLLQAGPTTGGVPAALDARLHRLLPPRILSYIRDRRLYR